MLRAIIGDSHHSINNNSNISIINTGKVDKFLIRILFADDAYDVDDNDDDDDSGGDNDTSKEAQSSHETMNDASQGKGDSTASVRESHVNYSITRRGE